MFCHPDGELNILNINFLHIQFILDESSSLVSLTGESLELEDWKPPCEGVPPPTVTQSHKPSSFYLFWNTSSFAQMNTLRFGL